jgi:hypothetical protein
MKGKYETPLSVSILRGIAWFLTGGGLLALFSGIVAQEPSTAFAGAGCLLCGLLYFILAGTRDATERTAFNTDRMASMMEKMETERTVAAAERKYGAPAPAASGTKTKTPPARRFFVDKPGGEVQGPMEIGNLQKLLNSGVITEETPVLQEGDEEWRTLGDFLAD